MNNFLYISKVHKKIQVSKSIFCRKKILTVYNVVKNKIRVINSSVTINHCTALRCGKLHHQCHWNTLHCAALYWTFAFLDSLVVKALVPRHRGGRFDSLPNQFIIFSVFKLVYLLSLMALALFKYLNYCTTLYCTTLHCTVVHCTVLHFTALHCTALHCTVLPCTALYCTAWLWTALHCTALPCTVLHCTTLHFPSLYYTALHCTEYYYI